MNTPLDTLLERTAHRLLALKGKVTGCNYYTISNQLEAFRAHEDMIPDVQEIVADFLVGFCSETAGWGDQELNEGERKLIRSYVHEVFEEALSGARDWADDVSREEAA